MALGQPFLAYDAIDPFVHALHPSLHGQHVGILVVEAGVGICVACTMTTLYSLFAARGRRQ